ncbi:MAG: cell division protein FtsZ [Tannerellaceae bacterium]|nr:cell division protein FtsZ [Tannerellaceae bacterium]
MNDTIDENFILNVEEPKIIKVIGVGGGGGNAVTHMYKKGIHDVTFLLCNTDKQALKQSSVPNKFVLGESITKGLGAGNRPMKAKEAAEASIDDIKRLLSDGTDMVFITAGMGGGTGTGAAPVIARTAREMGILTVGIVTIPFFFEGRNKILQALDGVDEINRNVDALLIINNERLRHLFPNATVPEAFAKADDTLAVAAKSIAEIITRQGVINIDFADVNTTLKDGGVALISNGYGEGPRRVRDAISDAIKSPLLNNNDVYTAQRLLFNISFSPEAELTMEEMDEIDDYMSRFHERVDCEVIWGTMIDETLEAKVKFTLLAAGFGIKDVIDDFPGTRIRREEDDKRIQKMYDVAVTVAPEYLVLSMADLDSDEAISMIEEYPTFRRDPKVVKEYRERSKRSIRHAEPPIASKGGSTAIEF